MGVTQNQKIQKVTANNIVGAITDFNTNVLTKAYNQATYHSGNVPVFSGTANIGSNNVGSVGFTNPAALPSNQMLSKSVPSLTLSDTTISASSLWSQMLTMTRALNKIRKFTSTWYHRQFTTKQDDANSSDANGGSLINKGSVSGTCVINASFPAVPTASNALGGSSTSWERSGTTSITLNPSSALTTNAQITAGNMNTTITNCYNTWYNTCISANALTYNLYTCHLNCHGNCYGTRSRR